MKIILKITVLTVCAFMTMSAFAQINRVTGFFVSLNTLPVFVYGVDVGYQFTPTIGLQAGAQTLWALSGFAGVDSATIYDVAARGILPIDSKAEFFGKLGVGMVNGTSNTYILNSKQTTDSVGVTYGLGFGYCFTPRWMLAVQATGIYSTGSQLIRSGFKTIPTINVTYHFA